jgi:hypothetical protein
MYVHISLGKKTCPFAICKICVWFALHLQQCQHSPFHSISTAAEAKNHMQGALPLYMGEIGNGSGLTFVRFCHPVPLSDVFAAALGFNASRAGNGKVCTELKRERKNLRYASARVKCSVELLYLFVH